MFGDQHSRARGVARLEGTNLVRDGVVGARLIDKVTEIDAWRGVRLKRGDNRSQDRGGCLLGKEWTPGRRRLRDRRQAGPQQQANRDAGGDRWRTKAHPEVVTQNRRQLKVSTVRATSPAVIARKA